ncbi:MAG: FAD-dependent oxidoreductase, partial [Rhizobiales bacterium]|nr:FAD-dependent oxidoreductase [Rhizobacter sp.]
GEPGVVIVGAGRAGWTLAQALREHNARSPITLVSDCAGDVYDKPMLSVAFARGLAGDSLVKERAAEAAARLGVRLLARTHAVSVTPGANQLRTTRGTLRYRHLVLAHGAAPRDQKTLPPTLCWRINHLDAYAAFRARLGALRADRPQRVVIAGAGLVGCELANDLALAGYPTTLLDIAPLPLASMLSAEQSKELLAAWKGLPIRFVGGVCIEGVTTIGAMRCVSTDDGREFHADHVIAATGLATPGRLAASAGLSWDNGIAVDAMTLRTSAPDIHALGDCISIAGQAHRYIEPIGRQARVIAAHIAGTPATPYVSRRPPVRVKTGSLGFTVAAGGG